MVEKDCLVIKLFYSRHTTNCRKQAARISPEDKYSKSTVQTDDWKEEEEEREIEK